MESEFGVESIKPKALWPKWRRALGTRTVLDFRIRGELVKETVGEHNPTRLFIERSKL